MLFLKSALLFAAASTATILVPQPKGSYDVALREKVLSDSSRAETLDPTAQSSVRRVVISVFLPIERIPGQGICPTRNVPYLSASVSAAYGHEVVSVGLQADILNTLEIAFCDLTKQHPVNRPSRSYPLIILSPGRGESRQIYSATARSIASKGYIVVTVDHPFDATIVDFLDGTTVNGLNASEAEPSEETAKKYILTRRDDLAFVIAQLEIASIRDNILLNFRGSIDLNRVIAIGHSWGGAAAVLLTQDNSRVKACVNLDGPIISVSRFPFTNFIKPILLIGRPRPSGSSSIWDHAWNSFLGFKAELTINGFGPASFTDRPLILGLLPISESARVTIQASIGTLEYSRIVDVLEGLLTTIFQAVFDLKFTVLRTISNLFKEVSLIRSSVF